MNTSLAYEYLMNGSIFKATNAVYQAKVGVIFWPLLFIWTLIIIAVKTESPNFVLFYAILGNYLIGKYVIGIFTPMFYMVAVLSLAIVLWKIFGK